MGDKSLPNTDTLSSSVSVVIHRGRYGHSSPDLSPTDQTARQIKFFYRTFNARHKLKYIHFEASLRCRKEAMLSLFIFQWLCFYNIPKFYTEGPGQDSFVPDLKVSKPLTMVEVSKGVKVTPIVCLHLIELNHTLRSRAAHPQLY